MRRLLLAFLLGLCGCGGSSSPASTPASAAVGSMLAPSFTMTVPAPSASAASRARHPQYVSPSTLSVTITLTSVNGSAPPAGLTTTATTNVPAGSCKAGCSITGPLSPPGSDTFTIVMYDAANAGGNALSQGTVTFTLSASSTSTTVTLSGIPAGVTISSFPSATLGSAFNAPQPFTLIVTDADGNVITGSYATPVTLTDSDQTTVSVGTGLAVNGGTLGKSVQVTSSTNALTFWYGGVTEFYLGGSTFTSTLTITASIPGVTSAPSMTTAFQPTVPSGGGGATPAPTSTPIGTPAALGSTTVDGSASATVSLTTTQAAPAGAAIIAIAGDSSGGTAPTSAACSDSGGNVYHTDVSVSSTGNATFTLICSTPALASQLASGSTITVTWTGELPPQTYRVAAWSVTGLASSPLDQTASATNTNNSPSSGTAAATSQANELLFGAISDGSNDTVAAAGFSAGTNATANICASTGTSTYTSLGGFTTGSNVPTVFGIYCVVSATGAYAAQATLTPVNAQWGAVLATYKGVTP